ncbi:MAG: hypothetical protein O3A84_10735 [Proteobacteria bacterium]|nr:hypothetical protein [Pseudomonadota bacterium]
MINLLNIVRAGAFLLIALAIAHAVYLGRSHDVEPILWFVSLFMLMQGLFTVKLMRG